MAASWVNAAAHDDELIISVSIRRASSDGHGPESEAPAAHRPRLAHPVEQDGALRHAVDAVDRHVLAVIGEPSVDLVAQHHQVALDGQLRDALAIVAGEHPAGRVGRAC